MGFGAIEMSLELLVLTDTDASIFAGIATYFAILNSGVLALLSFPLSVMVSASESFCNTANRSHSNVYSEIIATGQNQMGTIHVYMGNIPLTNLSMKDVPISSGIARLSRTPKLTRTCSSPGWIESMILL